MLHLSRRFSSPARIAFRKALARTGLALSLGSIALVGTGSPAMAEADAKTKLVRCGAQDCLQISGYRADPGLSVTLNGQVVDVEGQHSWRAEIPVETIRQWSAPNAREIEISLQDAASQQRSSVMADLPIGLLGDISALASLEVRAPY